MITLENLRDIINERIENELHEIDLVNNCYALFDTGIDSRLLTDYLQVDVDWLRYNVFSGSYNFSDDLFEQSCHCHIVPENTNFDDLHEDLEIAASRLGIDDEIAGSNEIVLSAINHAVNRDIVFNIHRSVQELLETIYTANLDEEALNYYNECLEEIDELH